MELCVHGINKSFGDKHVLKDLAFSARSGVAMGLLGRNGSGKTTTIRIIMGLFPADSGSVTIDGQPAARYKGGIGYLPEERGLYPKRRISDQMTYIGQLRGLSARAAKDRGKRLLELLDAGEYYHNRLDTLSKGNQQKVQLAIALINDPEIVILDEPFSGLDPVNAKILKDMVEGLVKEGRLVLFSSHQMGQVEQFCDDICILHQGSIVLEGNLKRIKKEYPRNRVLIVPGDENATGLRHRIGEALELKPVVREIRVAGRGCLVTLAADSDKLALFNAVAAMGVEVDAFQVVEPSLEEIFVEKAGDLDEAVLHRA